MADPTIAHLVDPTPFSNLSLWPCQFFDGRLPRRAVVLSPHFDDAVLSLGATIARSVQAGVEFEVVTVFGCDPSSLAPAEPWDFNSGFSTEGEAARARRDEDRSACLVLGATPKWLNFGAGSYERRGTPDQIWSAIVEATRGADCVLLPGYPLVHRDHADLARLALGRRLECNRVALYSEQPYTFYQRRTPAPVRAVPALQSVLHGAIEWKRLGATAVERRAKMRAVLAYKSQLRQLGLGLFGRHRMLWHEALQGGEAVAWV